jgi:dolichol-phosphate mannosyltransferase
VELGLFFLYQLSRYIKLKTLIIIPTLNESRNIKDLISKIDKLYRNIDILVVDDNSDDGTLNILHKIKKNKKNLKIICRKNDKGIGSAHLCGINYAYKKNYTICITMDADGTHNPINIRKMLKIIKYKNFNIVNTNRFLDSMSMHDWPLVRKVITYLRFFLVKIILNTNYDSSGGFRCYNLKKINKSHFLLTKNKNYFFLIESLFFFEKLDYRIYEIPNKLKFRSANQSKMKFYHLLESLWSLLRLRFTSF